MPAIFVTATGTGIGKTFVTTGLIRHWRDTGREVAAIKPVVSGFDPTAAHDSDPVLLLAALGRPASLEDIERISPWRLRAPLSPNMAARAEGRAIPYGDVIEFCRSTISSRRDRVLLIEGVGGVMVPLDDDHTVLDWMTMLRVPIVLVTGSYVGTISHTLTALEVVARRNLDIAAVVVSESEGSTASLADTVATLVNFAGVLKIVGLPRLPLDGSGHAAFADIAALL